jgi:hypothetical protein
MGPGHGGSALDEPARLAETVASARSGLHDVNNLLTALIVRAEMLAADLTGPDRLLAASIATIAYEAAAIATRLEVETAAAIATGIAGRTEGEGTLPGRLAD